jgi:hypothetical protein
MTCNWVSFCSYCGARSSVVYEYLPYSVIMNDGLINAFSLVWSGSRTVFYFLWIFLLGVLSRYLNGDGCLVF